MIEIQNIFNLRINEYCENRKLSIVQHKAVRAISDCRTEKLVVTSTFVQIVAKQGNPIILAETEIVLNVKLYPRKNGSMQENKTY